MNSTFTGNHIHALTKVVDIVCGSKDLQGRGILRAAEFHLDGALDAYFPEVTKYARDDNDVQAQYLLEEIRWCIETGRTAICDHWFCGDMQGMHSFLCDICRKQPWEPQGVLSYTFKAREGVSHENERD